jgi:hypothetical protein
MWSVSLPLAVRAKHNQQQIPLKELRYSKQLSLDLSFYSKSLTINTDFPRVQFDFVIKAQKGVAEKNKSALAGAKDKTIRPSSIAPAGAGIAFE